MFEDLFGRPKSTEETASERSYGNARSEGEHGKGRLELFLNDTIGTVIPGETEEHKARIAGLREGLQRRPISDRHSTQNRASATSTSTSTDSYQTNSQASAKVRRIGWGSVIYFFASVCLCFAYLALGILNSYHLVDAYPLLHITHEEDTFWNVSSRLWIWTDNLILRGIIIVAFFVVLPGAFLVLAWLAVFCIVLAFPVALLGLAFQMMQVSVVAGSVIGLIAVALTFFALRWFIRLTLKWLREG